MRVRWTNDRRGPCVEGRRSSTSTIFGEERRQEKANRRDQNQQSDGPKDQIGEQPKESSSMSVHI
jgi:hypothetical protein